MSLRCQNWVYEHSEATGNERLILLAIADEADDDGTNGHPGIDRIAHKARVNKRTTMRCIERLEEAGRLIVHRPETKGRGHFNTYVVVMTEGQKGDTLTEPERARNGDTKARNGAQPCLDGSRPVDPLISDPNSNTSRDVAFETFWNLYPRKTDKGGAQKAWDKAIKKATIGTITAGAQRFANDPNLPRDEPRFIPHPTTWLNGGRWNDDPLPPRSKPILRGPHRPTAIDTDRTAPSGVIRSEDL